MYAPGTRIVTSAGWLGIVTQSDARNTSFVRDGDVHADVWTVATSQTMRVKTVGRYRATHTPTYRRSADGRQWIRA